MKKMKRIAVLIISALMLLCALPLNASAMGDYSGTCGANVRWDYDVSSGTLTISGKGAMNEYGAGDDVPWSFIWEENDEEDGYIVLRKIVVKEGVTSIGNYAFSNLAEDEDLISVSLPKSLKRIGDHAFAVNCMKTFTVPKNVKTIGRGAFACADVQKFKVAKGNKYFSVKSGVLFNKKKTELVAYPLGRNGKSYKIPSSVKTIKGYAFCGNEAGICGWCSLTSITMPSKLKKIEGHAFEWTDLRKIKFQGKPPALGNEVFAGVGATVTYPKKYKSSWNPWINAKKWKAEDARLNFKQG